MKNPPRTFAERMKDDAKRASRVEHQRIARVPVGAVVAFAGPGSLPSGYVLCNGQYLDREEYVILFDTIGTTFGTTTATNFRVPTVANLATGIRYMIKT